MEDEEIENMKYYLKLKKLQEEDELKKILEEMSNKKEENKGDTDE